MNAPKILEACLFSPFNIILQSDRTLFVLPNRDTCLPLAPIGMSWKCMFLYMFFACVTMEAVCLLCTHMEANDPNDREWPQMTPSDPAKTKTNDPWMTSVLHCLFACFIAFCSQRVSFELSSAVFLGPQTMSSKNSHESDQTDESFTWHAP